MNLIVISYSEDGISEHSSKSSSSYSLLPCVLCFQSIIGGGVGGDINMYSLEARTQCLTLSSWTIIQFSIDYCPLQKQASLREIERSLSIRVEGETCRSQINNMNIQQNNDNRI